MKSRKRQKTKDQIDAERYRFLKSATENDDQNCTRTVIKVTIVGWGRNLPGFEAGRDLGGMWSQVVLQGSDVDKHVDELMLRNRNSKIADKTKDENTQPKN